MIDKLRIQRPKTMRQQIRDELREAIVDGRLAPGSALPSTRELAEKWNSPPANVHAALSTLVKEGLLVREPRIGTVVNKPEKKLERVALYSMESPNMTMENMFEHLVLTEISSEYARRGIEVETLIDPRPSCEQAEALPFLTEAAFNRRVQAVLAARVSPVHLRWLRKLPVVSAFVSSFSLNNTITIDDCQFIRKSLQVLYEQSVRRVGLIIPWFPASPKLTKGLSRQKNPIDEFYRQTQEWGMQTRQEWIKTTKEEIPYGQYEWFGHRAFKELRHETEHLDGLVVFTDFVARGVLHGILESNIRIPDELRLALHRNTELPYYCPVPATFIEISARQVAMNLIELIDRQFHGESVQNQTIPFSVNAARSETIPNPA